MSGVGSTNAMKKGSANNPFLAYSEADMQGYLKSAYTGCIVKYTGPSTKTGVPRGNNLNLGDAQNLVVDLTKSFTDNQGLSKSRKWYITIESETGNKCIMDITINKQTGVIGTPTLISDEIKALIYSIYTPYSSLIGSNINDLDVKFLSVTGTDVDRDVVTNWPTTSGWQKDCFNDSGKITLWGYGEKVTAIQNQNDMDYWSAYAILYTEPYVANVLYKVVYSNGQYYFEEFYHISENITTATVEDVAPGKTFYDFTGTKQTGTGTKINPYIASTADEMATYLTSSYKGAFVKYIGKTVSAGGSSSGTPLAVGDNVADVYFDMSVDVLSLFAGVADTSENVISFTEINDIILVKYVGGDVIVARVVGEAPVTVYYMSQDVIGAGWTGWNPEFSGSDTFNATVSSIVSGSDNYISFISKTSFTSGGGESYVKNAIYQVAEDGDTTRYAILPTLSNPADPIDVAEGKEVINQLGAVMIGTGNNVLQASTTEGMQALFIDANIGKIAKYVGETDIYIKDAFYLITSDANAKQYYELPALANEGTADDLALGKELINSKGEKVVGLVDLGDIQGKLFYGSVTYNTAVNGVDLSIPGLTKLPKFVLFMANASYGDSKNSVYNVVYPVPYNNNHERSYYLGESNYGSQNPVTFDENTKRLHIRTGNYDIHGTWYYYIIE